MSCLLRATTTRRARLGSTVLLLGAVALPTDAVAQSRVFVTSEVFDGAEVGGLTGADQKCNDAAASAGLDGAWVAWLSDETTGAVDRLADVGPWLRLDSVKVADDLADLTDGDIDAPIDVDETGATQSQDPGEGGVWTGTSPTLGREFGSGFTCSSWTSTSGYGIAGNLGFVDIPWSQSGGEACVLDHHLYCFETSSCTPGPTTACLNGGRFKVEIDWTSSESSGEGTVVQGVPSTDSGLFYFFDPDNWEMLIKVIDGCTINDRYWVFFAATTSVEFKLTVTDTKTGMPHVYANALDHPADPVQDTDAFATCP